MKAVDLFSGCGGLSKGFEEAGFELTLAIEHWDVARQVYEQNFDHPIEDLDLGNVIDATKRLAAEKPDLIVGGPPCQEFSQAGIRKEGEKAELTLNFAKITKNIQPKWFLLENVSEIQSSTAWSKSKAVLSKAGYGITECVLNAAYFGVPQKRKRFFAIGCLGEEDNFLEDQIEHGKSESLLTIREYLGDEFGIDYYYRHPRTWGRKGVFSIDEPSPTIRSTNRSVPPGYTPHPNDAGPSATARRLTAEERARIQTFSREFKLSGTMTDQNLMVANAVPVNLANHIARAIMRYEEESSMVVDKEFRTWLSSSQSYTPRTISNVVSRLNRASKILQIKNTSLNPLQAIQGLERSQEFQTLSPSVKSQIKRAIKLQAEYVNLK